MFPEPIDDLRPVPYFPRSVEEPRESHAFGRRLYKPAQYHLKKEKRLLSLDKGAVPAGDRD